MIIGYEMYNRFYCPACAKEHLHKHPEKAVDSASIDEHGLACSPYPVFAGRPVLPLSTGEGWCRECGDLFCIRQEKETEYVTVLLPKDRKLSSDELITRLSYVAPLALLMIKQKEGLHPDVVDYGRLLTEGVHEVTKAALSSRVPRVKDPLIIWDIVTLIAFALNQLHIQTVLERMRHTSDVDAWKGSASTLLTELYPATMRSGATMAELVVQFVSAELDSGTFDLRSFTYDVQCGIESLAFPEPREEGRWHKERLPLGPVNASTIPSEVRDSANYLFEPLQSANNKLWEGLMAASVGRDDAGLLERITRFFRK